MASLFKTMQSRQMQKKAQEFIENLSKLSDKEIEEEYLNNKEFENNEIVLSYLFFHHPKLIRILPLEFQKSRINSNLNMFYEGSVEARREVVIDWLHGNKFFMNCLVVGLQGDDYEEYLRLYFKEPEDVAKLYMGDLKSVITVLAKSDLKQTEEVLEKIRDKLTDKQWEYVIEVNPLFIKYASQTIQKKYSEDETYSLYLSGDARKNYIDKQINKIKGDISIFNTLPFEIQREYINRYPFMINYLDIDIVNQLLRYDSSLMKYIKYSVFKNKTDKNFDLVYYLFENINNKSSKDIVDLFVDKGLLNAKGKVYRFDKKSNNLTYQYTKRLIQIMQSLSIEQMIPLIEIDSNYVLPYVLPIYNDNADVKLKETIIIDANSRCLNLFKAYLGQKYYDDYYRVINKIYKEYISNINKYDYQIDYNCVFDLLKILFNKKILFNNSRDKISIFIGMSILYKDSDNTKMKETSIKLLNELLTNAYGNINNDLDIYNLYSLEQFDGRLSFIPEDLLKDFCSYNYINMSNLLLIVKSNKNRELFKYYYDIVSNIYYPNKQTLYKCIENFTYYKQIISDVVNSELTDEEEDNLIELFSSFGNLLNIRSKKELDSYDKKLLKELLLNLSAVKDINVHKNLIANYLFNIGYDEKGSFGWLDLNNIKQLVDLYEVDTLYNVIVDGNNLFDEDDVNLFTLIKLLFDITDSNLLINYISEIMSNKIERNIVGVTNLFNKLKKYRFDIINSQIVSMDEIKMLYESNPDMVTKIIRNDVTIYSIKDQDFRVLCSLFDDGVHFECSNVSELKKNCYGYDKLEKNGSLRFAMDGTTTILKLNKDRLKTTVMRVSYVLVVGKITDELLSIAKKHHLPIVSVNM